MRTKNRKMKEIRKSIALFLVLLLTLGTTLVGFSATSVIRNPEGMRPGGNSPPINGCSEYKLEGLGNISKGIQHTFYFDDLIHVSGSKNVSVTDYVYVTFYDDDSMDWVSNLYLGYVYVKGGPGGNLYEYDPSANNGSGLTAPDGKGISNVVFYYCGATPPPPPPPANVRLVIEKELVDDNDITPQLVTEFEIIVQNGVREEIWKDTITESSGYEDNELPPDKYYVKENVKESEYEVTYLVGEHTITPGTDGFVELDLTSKDADVTLVIQNKEKQDPPPEQDRISLELVKKIVRLDNEENEIEVTNRQQDTFKVAVEKQLQYATYEVNENGIEDPFVGEFVLRAASDGSKLIHHDYEGIPALYGYYTLEETELEDDDIYSLLRFEIEFFDEDGKPLFENHVEADSFSIWDVDEQLPAKIKVTAVNLYTPDEDEPGTGILNVNKTVTGNAPTPNTYGFVIRRDVEEGETWESGPHQLIPGTPTTINNLQPGSYTIEETQTRGANTVTYSQQSFTIAETGTTTIDITITNTFQSGGGGGGGGTGGGGTGGGTPTTVSIPVEPTPLGVSVPEEAPVIVLEQPVPLAAPQLPQTGDSNPLHFLLAGLFLTTVGIIFRKRVTR